jgi:hypothetical protein
MSRLLASFKMRPEASLVKDQAGRSFGDEASVTLAWVEQGLGFRV